MTPARIVRTLLEGNSRIERLFVVAAQANVSVPDMYRAAAACCEVALPAIKDLYVRRCSSDCVRAARAWADDPIITNYRESHRAYANNTLGTYGSPGASDAAQAAWLLSGLAGSSDRDFTAGRMGLVAFFAERAANAAGIAADMYAICLREFHAEDNPEMTSALL